MGRIIFGRPWDAPVCDGARWVDPPIGETCLYCAEPIEEGDRGFLLPAVTADGTVTPRPTHRECDFVQVAGNLAHVQGRCQHVGHCNELREAEGRSVREDAIAAWEFYQRGV